MTIELERIPSNSGPRFQGPAEFQARTSPAVGHVRAHKVARRSSAALGTGLSSPLFFNTTLGRTARQWTSKLSPITQHHQQQRARRCHCRRQCCTALLANSIRQDELVLVVERLAIGKLASDGHEVRHAQRLASRLDGVCLRLDGALRVGLSSRRPYSR